MEIKKHVLIIDNSGLSYTGEDINGAIFERMIIIVPYKAADHVKAI